VHPALAARARGCRQMVSLHGVDVVCESMLQQEARWRGELTRRQVCACTSPSYGRTGRSAVS
jgi:hypothetical protein